MKTEKIRVYFTQTYGGGVRAGVVIGEEHNGKTWGEIEKLKKKKGYKEPQHYVMDASYLEEKLEKEIAEKGYTTGKSNRQKYTRLTINI